MSPWLILFLSKVDIIVTTAEIVLTLSLILLGFATIFVPSCPDENFSIWFKEVFKKIIWIPIVCLLIVFTVPKRDTAILMWVLPKLTNSQMVQKDFPELYDKAMKIISNEIEKKLNGDKK